MTMLTMAKALNAGLRRALEADSKVVIAGEDVGKLGGVFRVTEGLQKDWRCAATARCVRSSSMDSSVRPSTRS